MTTKAVQAARTKKAGKTTSTNKPAKIRPYWVPAFQFGQCGRFETLAVHEKGWCQLEKDGTHKVINLRDSVLWLQGIHKADWWGDYKHNDEGIALWYSLVANHMDKVGSGDVTKLNRFFRGSEE